jgi:hypothetical protein
VELATGETLATGAWAPDNFHLSFQEVGTGAAAKVSIVGADGSGLRQLQLTAERFGSSVFSADQKTIYVAGFEKGSQLPTTWRVNTDGSNPEKLVDNCAGEVSDIDMGGSTRLGLKRQEKGPESTRSPCLIGNASL